MPAELRWGVITEQETALGCIASGRQPANLGLPCQPCVHPLHRLPCAAAVQILESLAACVTRFSANSVTTSIQLIYIDIKNGAISCPVRHPLRDRPRAAAVQKNPELSAPCVTRFSAIPVTPSIQAIYLHVENHASSCPVRHPLCQRPRAAAVQNPELSAACVTRFSAIPITSTIQAIYPHTKIRATFCPVRHPAHRGAAPHPRHPVRVTRSPEFLPSPPHPESAGVHAPCVPAVHSFHPPIHTAHPHIGPPRHRGTILSAGSF